MRPRARSDERARQDTAAAAQAVRHTQQLLRHQFVPQALRSHQHSSCLAAAHKRTARMARWQLLMEVAIVIAFLMSVASAADGCVVVLHLGRCSWGL